MEVIKSVTARQTKYATAVLETLQQLTHATNLELLQEVQKAYPEVSATTIHRVTGRLKDRGIIGAAPATASGAERFDTSPDSHHHFMCSICSNICDIPQTDESTRVMQQLKELSGKCAIAGTLTMLGTCHGCVNNKEEE